MCDVCFSFALDVLFSLLFVVGSPMFHVFGFPPPTSGSGGQLSVARWRWMALVST